MYKDLIKFLEGFCKWDTTYKTLLELMLWGAITLQDAEDKKRDITPEDAKGLLNNFRIVSDEMLEDERTLIELYLVGFGAEGVTNRLGIWRMLLILNNKIMTLNEKNGT